MKKITKERINKIVIRSVGIHDERNELNPFTNEKLEKLSNLIFHLVIGEEVTLKSPSIFRVKPLYSSNKIIKDPSIIRDMLYTVGVTGNIIPLCYTLADTINKENPKK